MEFRNLTPFSVMQYAMDDKHNERHCVVAMKTGFRLIQDVEGQWLAQLMENPVLPLCMEDEYAGEINKSPVLRESDLAPLKPACDIIVNGTVYAPDNIAVPEMTAGLLMRSSTGEVLIDKKLRITGPRFYRQQPLTGQWYETEPEPFTSLQLNYHYAFGGECRIEADSDYADRIPEENRLTDEQRREHPERDNPPLAHMACPVNPLGLGYTQAWYLRACELREVEAPRIIAMNSPFTLKQFTDCLNGNGDWFAPEYQPAGFGVIGRAWLPRLPLAGTYDQEWLETQHPDLPDDFDFNYWNCAPDDQRIPFPLPGGEFVLTGFRPEGDIRFSLPAHEGRLLIRAMSGHRLPLPMLLDTLEINTDTLTVALTWRFLLPGNTPPVRVLEARYRTRSA
ncbi:DUF2169 domain-containing protein [Citrobacter europaeus]|uniref:DUF2169 family type VI secretion system accessory protein n=1 Tax=Citrobacter europaeus TaxID=1914243 RepID=UPI000F4EB8B7|nr:DUF2169 domain-containing protein [Citrobacter europaeus]ROW36376.1 DUF2169 domain-containing protein [Citrobacter europaeus]